MQILARLLLLWLALLAPQIAFAQELNVPGRLIAETDRPAAGGTVTLAFLFEPKPGWHGYWENPGDAGLGLQLEWKLPEGVTAGKLRYPVPKPLLIGGLMNHVFEDPHAILVDVEIDDQIRPGTRLPISVAGNWLACTDSICVPQQGRFTLELVSGNGLVNAAQRIQFDNWRSTIPVPLDQPARYAVKGKTYQLAIPYPAAAPLNRPYFFALSTEGIRYAAPQQARRSGDWLVIETEVQGVPRAVEGLLRIGDGQGLLIHSVPGVIPTGGDTIPVLGSKDKQPVPFFETPGSPLLLLGAFFGGLLLNLMPCVFPILGLKALALARAGGDEQSARADALAYSAGVIVSCVALGGMILGLRAGGKEVGWAFQLQEPAFVLFLLLLMVAVTANLAGLFELRGFDLGNKLTQHPGNSGSFWTGVLAALVATPCTGPFMAAALGAALLLPAFEAILLFATLGLGIALPFLMIAYVPRLRAMLPKPGPWLYRFRTAMAVPMGLTALALAWLLWRQVGETGLWVGIVASMLTLFLLAMQTTMGGLFRHSGIAMIGLLLLIFVGASRWLPDDEATSVQSANLLGEPFDAQRLVRLRAEGKPVFLYFTADWCVTCKINEAAALNVSETAKLFREKDITIMVGDFTKRDPAIARFLAEHGRSGVPLYLYYPPQGQQQILPQILTPAIVADAVSGSP